MAFTDVTDGSRIIQEGIGPVKITLGEAVKVGDMIVYNSGWVEADGSTHAEATGPLLCAGEEGASADVITAYHKARISGITTGTAGNPLYLSDTQGDYSADAGTVVRVVGYELGGTEFMFDPNSLAGTEIDGAGKIFFRDSGIWLSSTGDGLLKISADHTTSAAAITLADAVTFSDSITMAAGKIIYIRGTGALLSSTAAGKVKLAATGAGADDITLSGTVTLGDHISIPTAKSIRGATGNNKTLSIAVGSATGTAFSDVINVSSATTLAKRELGFLGATPVAQQATIADTTAAGATTINAILLVLEKFGLTATA